MTWGIVPAAGVASRLQPLAFSKELLPVGSRIEDGVERPRAVGEYLIERMIHGGATKICFVISPTKSDIIGYFAGVFGSVRFAYVVQETPGGLCDAIFQALPLIPPDEPVLIGLPDTIWFPEDALAGLPDDRLSLLCFPVAEPRQFDAVRSDPSGRILEIQVKHEAPASHWVWGAFKLPARTLAELHALWHEPGRHDTYVGTLINAWIARGGSAFSVHAGTDYVDVGTLHGWRDAARLLDGRASREVPRPYRAATTGERSGSRS
ncbi:MAG TPA: sugar phosphate nucleotidyltransferase [Kofleriaceae bacterium]|jgi:dTDP-glucose pyrophosphorylase|nr:sugar phosphate nucleotidyltransferase [Kofleriaceae bacterium]